MQSKDKTIICIATVLALAACQSRPEQFAVIGDYGTDSEPEALVARLVSGWRPQYVLTLGDNNYPSGERSTIDQNIGKYYSDFIGNYQGRYGKGSVQNRFWPSIGNHESYGPEGLQPYLDYFPALPGNRRYYEVVIGKVHLFAIDSDFAEPDGNDATSIQARWLRERLQASTACFKVVYFHHPPYSSGQYAVPTLRWPFQEMGADVLLAGHEHFYERLDLNGLPLFINGLGGYDRFDFLPTPTPESRFRYNGNWGAMLVTVGDDDTLSFEFRTIDDMVIDRAIVRGSGRCEGL